MRAEDMLEQALFWLFILVTLAATIGIADELLRARKRRRQHEEWLRTLDRQPMPEEEP